MPNSLDAVTRWKVVDLCALIAGSSRKTWSRLTPELIRLGVITKRGRAFYGRKSEIELALIGRLDYSANSAVAP